MDNRFTSGIEDFVGRTHAQAYSSLYHFFAIRCLKEVGQHRVGIGSHFVTSTYSAEADDYVVVSVTVRDAVFTLIDPGTNDPEELSKLAESEMRLHMGIDCLAVTNSWREEEGFYRGVVTFDPITVSLSEEEIDDINGAALQELLA